MPLQATSGAASYDAFGGGVPVVPNYIEDVFSTYLYAGTGATQTITNGIDESGKGAMTWIKCRSDATSHALYDTERGAGRILTTNTTGAQTTSGSGRGLSSFNSTGFSLDDDSFSGRTNQSGSTYASWTFRKQPKFFDVLTYTGDGNLGRTVAHNLGSVPGCIIIKNTGTGGTNWGVYHRSVGATGALFLNQTYDVNTSSNYWNNTTPTSTVFTVGNQDWNNQSGESYVAYLFAHDAGGFGLTGTDNVISCGSYTEGASAQNINLGYEPQWLLMKKSNGTGAWYLFDTMRGMSQTDLFYLVPNTSAAEDSFGAGYLKPTATGFTAESGFFGNGSNIIYIAIRRGPMKVPTSGTSVFQPTAFTSQSGDDTVSSGSVSVVDWGFVKKRASSEVWIAGDRLRGGSYLSFDATSAEASNVFKWDKQNAFVTNVDDTPSSFIGYSFRRAPSFFDEVCYTGTGSARTVTHNLAAVPELMIVKARNNNATWAVYAAPLGATKYLQLENNDPSGTLSAFWNDTAPTSTVFTLGTASGINGATIQGVAYLFATCAGVSKVGSYTGTATTKQIDCGFTGGARFVLIRRTDSTGDWYVWDSARGIVSGNDSYLLLNSTAAEVTNTDYIDTYSAGFEISSTAPAAINASGGSFIFFAVA